MIILKVDEEVQGTRKEYETVTEIIEDLNELVDERTYEVIIKKRAAANSSQGCSTNFL